VTTTITAGDEATTIVLTRDELHVLLRLLGVKALNGQSEANGAPVSAEEEAIRRNCGEQTLQARGLLTFEAERHVTLDDSLVALAGSAALPQATYMLQQVFPDGKRATHYFSRGPDLLVEHTSPKAGIFEFRRLGDEAALQERIGTLTADLTACVGAVRPATARVAAKGVADCLSHYASHYAEDKGEAAASLIGGGCPAELAHELVRALNSYPHWLAVCGRTDVSTQRVISSTALIVRGAASCWLFESDSNPDGSVSIHALDGEASRSKLAALAEPLQHK
jgi:hypothetical protein